MPRISAILDTGVSGQDALWIALYLGFGLCAGTALTARTRRIALFSTIAQSALALAILAAGMPHFEGALLALVGAQTRLVVPARIAFAWIAISAYMPIPRDPRDNPLTPRECEVLRLMATGLSNREIAHQLGTSEGTIKNHASSILMKLDVRDRTRAVLVALRDGWI